MLIRPSKRFLPFIAIAFLAITTQSCQKTIIQEEKEAINVDQLRSFIANSTGHSLNQVLYSPDKKEFVIDNDVLMSVKEAKEHFEKNQKTGDVPSGVNGTTQRVHVYKITAAKAANIRIYVDATVPSIWHSSINNSITNWNNTVSGIYMNRVYATTSTATTTTGKGKNKTTSTTTSTSLPQYDILVTSNYEASNTIATAYYPNSLGNPGYKVTINTYHNSLGESYKLFAMTHEFGHNIGLTHTDGTYGSLIPGTPEVDPNSVMNSICLSWSSFTNYDLVAVRTVYPK